MVACCGRGRRRERRERKEGLSGREKKEKKKKKNGPEAQKPSGFHIINVTVSLNKKGY